jgi:hypothetical protein
MSGIPKDQHGHAVGIMHPLLEVDVGFQFTNFVLKKRGEWQCLTTLKGVSQKTEWEIIFWLRQNKLQIQYFG